jgi:hypothetical protein
VSRLCSYGPLSGPSARPGRRFTTSATIILTGTGGHAATCENVKSHCSRPTIYRVQSSQSLGRFSVDRTFVQTLKQKLSAKYGPPLSDYADVFSWEIIEDVTMPDGNRGPFRTMWMTAMIGGQETDPTLNITLIDFRILWADQASVNRAPRAEAEDRIAF